jgi:phosphatidylserine decarboxylase
MLLTRDGLREITLTTLVLGGGGGVAAYLAVTASPWFWLVAVPGLAAWLFTLCFFRDPPRTVPAGEGLLVAPADGKVTEITQLESHEGIDGPALRIGIFLSIFDVHINRAPCAGRVTATAYTPGEFLDARHEQSGARNEANTVIINPTAPIKGPVIVRQIAGLIARRIVCRVGTGATVARGEKFGMIKFGSRTELIVPAGGGLEPAVKLNDHVRAGRTIIMRPAGSGTT